jgi:hypothetical protein
VVGRLEEKCRLKKELSKKCYSLDLTLCCIFMIILNFQFFYGSNIMKFIKIHHCSYISFVYLYMLFFRFLTDLNVYFYRLLLQWACHICSPTLVTSGHIVDQVIKFAKNVDLINMFKGCNSIVWFSNNLLRL